MKSTGIVRKVDELGRVVLPIELRRNMGIEIKDSLEIFVDENTIILQKYEPAAAVAGSDGCMRKKRSVQMFRITGAPPVRNTRTETTKTSVPMYPPH